MKYIFYNLRGLWRSERLLFCIMCLSIFASSLLLQFAYGLYQNYHVVLSEMTDELKEIVVSVNSEPALTVAELREYIAALPREINDDCVIYTRAYFGCYADHINRTDAEWEALRQELAYYEDVPEDVYPLPEDPEEAAAILEPYREQHPEQKERYDFELRFCYRNGDFASMDVFEENIEKNNWLISGRHMSDTEYATGAHVTYADLSEKSEQNYLRIDDDHISLWGEPFKIVMQMNGSSTPIVSICAVPDDVQIREMLDFLFDKNIDRKRYDMLKETAEEIIPGKLVFPELPFPDNSSMYLYRNIMLISALIAALSVLNFVMLYHFILQQRSRKLAIFRLTGCTGARAARMYLGECLTVGVPVYLLGTAVFQPLLHRVFPRWFPYMEAAYSLPVYAAIFGMYLGIMILMLAVTVTLHVRRTIRQQMQ